MPSTRWFVVATLLALALPWVLAQGGAPAPTAFSIDPLNADAAAPAIAAPRIFGSYHVYRDTGPSPWHETSATVSPQPDGAAHGSHAGYSLPANAPPVSSNKSAGEPMPGMHHH